MRIAFISPTSGLGGGEMMMLTLATWCRDFGHSVLVLAPAEDDQWLPEEAERRGLDVHRFHRSGPLDVRCLRELTRVMRERRVDLVHGHMFTGAYFGVAAARMLRIPSVVTFHGGAEQTDVLRRRVVIKWAIRNSDVATVVAEQMRRDLSDALGARYSRLDVIANGMPEQRGDRRRVRAEIRLRDDEKLVTAIGSCCERKNHVALIHALVRLPESVPWRLAICGRDDDATAQIHAAIESHGVHDRVHLLGVRLDTGDVLAATDVFAMPSLWEGTPLALIEAMMAGKPCLASTAGGMPAMIEDGETGMLTAATDYDAIAKALGTLITDTALAARLGAAAKARAGSAYGLEKMCEQYQAIYASLGAKLQAAL